MSAVDSLITEARRQAAEIQDAARRPVAVSILLHRLAGALESVPVAAPTREQIVMMLDTVDGLHDFDSGDIPSNGEYADAVLALFTPGLTERTTK